MVVVHLEWMEDSKGHHQNSEPTHADISSFEPWSLDFALSLANYYRKYDSIAYIFPNSKNRIATAGAGNYPIIPGVLKGNRRNGLILPTSWMTLQNFPQIFHEYTHTVEAAIGDMKATSHSNDETKKLRELTNQQDSNESDWLSWHWEKTVQPKIDKWSSEKGRQGYKDYFGFSLYDPLTISDARIIALFNLKTEKGTAYLEELRRKAEEKDKLAYEYFNKKSNAKEAALSSLESAELYPWQDRFLNHAEWFIEHSGMGKEEKETLRSRLNAIK